MICTIEHCGGKSIARGYCRKHYARFYTHGDANYQPSMARNGEPFKFLQSLVETSTQDCVVWPYASKRGAYGVVWVNGKIFGAHRAMCQLAHGDPFPSAHAAHSCGNKLCVNPNHLRWATPKENSREREKHGTVPIGENNAAAKLTRSEVLEIKLLVCANLSHEKVAAKFNVSRKTVGAIVNGITWRHI